VADLSTSDFRGKAPATRSWRARPEVKSDVRSRGYPQVRLSPREVTQAGRGASKPSHLSVILRRSATWLVSASQQQRRIRLAGAGRAGRDDCRSRAEAAANSALVQGGTPVTGRDATRASDVHRAVRAAVAAMRQLGFSTAVHVRSSSSEPSSPASLRPAAVASGSLRTTIHKACLRRRGVRVCAFAEFDGYCWRFDLQVRRRGHNCPTFRRSDDVSGWFSEAVRLRRALIECSAGGTST
jgi:hypothetical protein